MSTLFTGDDRRLMDKLSMTEQSVLDQIEQFRKGPELLSLNRPCTRGDGIHMIDVNNVEKLRDRYEEARRSGRITFFVPASGAASRMFEKWFRLRTSSDDGERQKFLHDLPRYPFYRALAELMEQKCIPPAGVERPETLHETLDCILADGELELGNRPKALIPFHRYSDKDIRTALEEHLVEASLYGIDESGTARLHLTLSPEHESDVRKHIDTVVPALEKRLDLRFNISQSPQHPSTNTLAVDPDNRPFRDKEGFLVFRPGGHGALLKNLNDLKGDIVFIKNIDNITPDRLKPDVVYNRILLGGYLLDIQSWIFEYLRLLKEGTPDKKTLERVETFCRETLNLRPPHSYELLSPKDKADHLFGMLNRPLRVCGMVQNEGEPGGGPFWIDEGDGAESLQIVEGNQVDRTAPEQQKLWKSSTHFNPVDIACGLRDFEGNNFNLGHFCDPSSFMVSEKSHQGKPLKALEHPGLWNGSMARWNTIFVEVPLFTFAPVKTVEDLLRPEHQP